MSVPIYTHTRTQRYTNIPLDPCQATPRIEHILTHLAIKILSYTHTRTLLIKALPSQLHSNRLQQQELTEISNSALYDTVHQDEWHCTERTRHQRFITVVFFMGLVGRQSHWTSANPERSHFEDGVQDIWWELNKKLLRVFSFSSLHQYSS